MEKADIVQLLGEKEHLALNSLNIFPNFLFCKTPNFLQSCSNSAHLPPSRCPSLTFALASWLQAVGHSAPDLGPAAATCPLLWWLRVPLTCHAVCRGCRSVWGPCTGICCLVVS